MISALNSVDRRRLSRGTVTAAVVAGVGLAGLVIHNVALYDPRATPEEGTAVLFTEMLIFGAIALLGLVASTFLAVWRAEARRIRQSLAAIALTWSVTFVPGAIVGAFLFGGLVNVVHVVLVAFPAYVIAQAAAAILAALLGRMSSFRSRNAAH